MKSLEILAEQIKQVPSYVDSSFDFMNMGSFFTKQWNVQNFYIQRSKAKSWKIYLGWNYSKDWSYVEDVKFPEYLLSKLRDINLNHNFLKLPYGNPLSIAAQGALIA